MIPRAHLPAYFRALPVRLRYERKLRNIFSWREPQRRAAEIGLRIAERFQPPTGDEIVVFSVPVIAKSRANNWETVSALLEETLASLRAQSDPRWRAIVCCQDRPLGLREDDQVSFLPFPPGSPPKFDKNDKRTLTVEHLVAEGPRTGYFYPLDADDLIHKDLVKYILGDNNGYGYLVAEGYRLAPSLRHGWALGPRSLREFRFTHDTLWGNCGSSMALSYDLRPEGIGMGMVDALVFTRHGRSAHLSAAIRHRLPDVPFPAVIYRTNHGENKYKKRAYPPKIAQRHLDRIAVDFPSFRLDAPRGGG